MSNQYDHCRNCTFWDSENQDTDRKAQCTKHDEKIYIRGWCSEHQIRNKHDYNDPSVIYRFDMDILLKTGIPKNMDMFKKSVLDGIRIMGYKGPDDYHSLMRDYDTNYPHLNRT